MFGLKPKPAPAVKRLPDPESVAIATITLRERSATKFDRNVRALELLSLAAGLPAACAHQIASDCTQQPLRLYRAGSVTVRYGKVWAGNRPTAEKGRPVSAFRRKRFMGKAAQWADTGGNVVEVTDHPVLDVLNRPNATMTGTQMAYLSFWARAITGEWYEAKIGGKVLEQLWPLYPQYTQPIPSDGTDERMIRVFAYGRDRSQVIDLDADDVIQYKFRPHPDSPYHGYSPLVDVQANARFLLENDAYDVDSVENGNIPPGFFNLDPTVYPTESKVREWMAALKAKTRGRRGKTEAIAGAGVSWVPINRTDKDLATAEKIARHEARIRQAFGIPESMLEMNDANMASAHAGNQQYWAGTIRPILTSDAEQKTEYLLPEFGEEPGVYFFAYDDPVLADLDYELRVHTGYLASGVMTINEVRAELNRDSIGEDGDVYRINGVPLAQSGQAPASPLFTLHQHGVDVTKGNGHGNDDDTEHSCSGSNRDSGEKCDGRHNGPADAGCCGEVDSDRRYVDGDARAKVGPGLLAHCHAGPDPYGLHGCSCGLTTKDDDDDRFLQEITVPAEAISPQLAARQTAALRAAMAAQVTVLEAFFRNAQGDAVRQVLNGSPIDLSGSVDELASKLEPSFREMFRAGFDFGALEIGEDPEIDPFSLPNAEAVAEAQTSLIRQLSKDVTDHAAQAIEQRVQAGMEAGKDIRTVAKEIEEDTGFARHRAERVARTEMSNAANAGKRARFKAAGVKTVYWVNAPGASAVHRAIAARYPDGNDIDAPFIRAGETIKVGDESETYTRDTYHPPARPNCRCSLQTRQNDRSEDDD